MKGEKDECSAAVVARHYVLGLAALSQHIQTISLSHNKDSNQKIRFFVCGPYCTCNNVKDDAMIVDQVIELLLLLRSTNLCFVTFTHLHCVQMELDGCHSYAWTSGIPIRVVIE